MTGKRLEFFLKAIGYPDRAPAGSGAFMLRVDGMEVLAEEADERIVLSYGLTDEESMFHALATYASGRMLVEDAALAYGLRQGGAVDRPLVFLWQESAAGVDEKGLLRFFETFMGSCDWWRARVDSLRGDAAGESEPKSMVIRP